MGRKKDKEDKLLPAEPEDLHALIRRAQQADGVSKEKYTAPAWYEIGRLWREDPCSLVLCAKHGERKYPANRWDAITWLFRLGIVLTVYEVWISGGWLNSVAWCLASIAFLFISLWTDQKSQWQNHEPDLKKKFQEQANRNPAEMVVKYLSTELESSRQQLLGEISPLRELQKRLQERIQGVGATAERLRCRASRRSGALQQALADARQKMDALMIRLRAGLEQLEGHIASVEAFFRECEAKIQALKEPLDDLPLLEQAVSHESGAEQELGQVEGVIMDSVWQLQSRMGEMQSRISAAMAEPAKHLFLASEGASLDDDLARYEQAAAQAFPSELSPADAKP